MDNIDYEKDWREDKIKVIVVTFVVSAVIAALMVLYLLGIVSNITQPQPPSSTQVIAGDALKTSNDAASLDTFDQVFNNIEKAAAECEKSDSFPFIKQESEVKWRCDYSWTAEYSPMAFWLNYEHRPTQENLDKAIHITQRYADNYDKMYDSMNHGFYGMPFTMAYKNTGDERWKLLAIQSADKMVGKYNQTYNVIFHHPAGKDQVVVDSMANLELLLWAHNETHNETYLMIAEKQTNAVIDNMFKDRNTTGALWHARDWVSGRTYNAQADNNDVAWGRGQAWFLYGSQLMYEYTKNPKYKSAFYDVSDFYMTNSKDGVIENSIGGTSGLIDTSGTSIANVAFIRMGRIGYPPWLYTFANRSISALKTPEYLKNGALQHGCYASTVCDLELIWGDYYFLQSIHELEV